jgi:hypothetical protein
MQPAVPGVVILTENAQARFCVEVRPPQSAQMIEPSIESLMEHLERCLGASVPWYDRWSTDIPPVRLVLKLDVLSDLGSQEFEIAASQDQVVIRAATPRGVDYGVHHFLETIFGVRWLWPGDTGRVTPKAHNVRVQLGTTRHQPSYDWRQLWVGGSFWREDDCWMAERKHGGVSARTMSELALWQRRRRLGGLKIADGHRWAEICSPMVYGQSHPEYFALVKGQRDVVYTDGKHGNQPCTSNPDVVRITADYIKAQFKRQPDLDGFSIASNDGLGFCQCDKCVAVDKEVSAGSHNGGVIDAVTNEQPGKLPADHASITDRMLRFANAVAQEVVKEFPDKLLLTLIYSVYRNPPKQTKLHPSVIAQFCSMGHTHTEAAVFESEMATFKKLGGFAQRLGVYEYVVNGANGSLPRGTARQLGRSISKYHELGARYYASQSGLDFGLAGLGYYFMSEKLWDVSAGFEQVLGDYCRSGFGPAAAPVERYLQAFCDRWEECWPHVKGDQRKMEALVGVLYPEPWLATRRAELNEARELTAGDAHAAARVAFLADTLTFLELLGAACAAGLESAGAADDQNMRQAFIRRRDALVSWVDAHRDGVWIAAMWFDYQRLVRSGMLGPGLNKSLQKLH